MQPVFFYGLATAATVALSIKRPDARFAAFTIAAVWAAGLVVRRLGLSDDVVLTVGVTCDTLAAIGFVIAWRVIWPPKGWLFAVALAFFGQVAAHRSFDGDADSVHRLRLILNVLYALQLLTVVIGPRVGQIIGHARGAFSGLSRSSSCGDRPRGVVASFDWFLCRIGAAALREKSR